MPNYNPVRGLRRWREVQAILLRYGFDLLIDREEIKEVRRFLQDRLGLSLGEFNDRSLPERVRLMLQELGPTYVKVGQIVSSRSDLLPAPWIDELVQLQDRVAPIPYKTVYQVITEELGAPPEEIFDDFDPTPIAAASIGQVHHAYLPDRRPVVIKVQRPGIRPRIEADMEIMREIARIIESRTDWGKKYGILGIVNEFARSLFDELDYRNEGRNAERLKLNMADFPGVHIPHIYWDLVTSRVLTMEEMRGVKINDLPALDEIGVDRAALADVLIRSLCKQMLLDGFYHADPHPANIFVTREYGELVYLDLGMMGQLVDEQREGLTNVVLAIQDRDSHEIVRIAKMLGTEYKPVEELKLRRDVDLVLDRYLAMSLDRVSFSELVSEVLSLIFDHGIRLPNELTMAVKSLVQAEELARTLHPEIKITEIANTVARQLLWARVSPHAVLTEITRDTREAIRLARVLPKAAEKLLQQIEAGALQIGLEIPEFHSQVQHLYTIVNRLSAGLILAGMLVGSAIAMGSSPHESWAFIPVLGVVSFLASMVIGGFLVWDTFIDMWRTRRKRRK